MRQYPDSTINTLTAICPKLVQRSSDLPPK
jgi:hypothetical protein